MCSIEKIILVGALVCFSIYACVPVLKETMGDKAADITDKRVDSFKAGQSQEQPTESKSSVEKDKPSHPTKDAIGDDWHARRLSSVEKEKTATSKKNPKQTSPKNQSRGTIVSESKVEKTLSEQEEKVKKVAIETLKGLSSPIKYTICYDEENDEWWLTVYEDIGHALDVKQYFWTPQQEKLEPFLVLNRIPKGRLTAELSKQSDRKKCSIHEPVKPVAQ